MTENVNLLYILPEKISLLIILYINISQADLRDTVGLASDHNKTRITIKEATYIFPLPTAYKLCLYYTIVY